MIARQLSRFSFRLLLGCLLTAFAAGLLTFTTPQPAQALCARQAMEGDWRNVDANTRSVTRVVVWHECGDTGGPSYWAMHPSGKCHPTDCDWGSRRAQTMSGGWQRSTFTYSWATTNVWIKTYTYYNRLYLRVYTSTDFTDADGRTDYTTDEWMLKA
jgi:hypothetical protein